MPYNHVTGREEPGEIGPIVVLKDTPILIMEVGTCTIAMTEVQGKLLISGLQMAVRVLEERRIAKLPLILVPPATQGKF